MVPFEEGLPVTFLITYFATSVRDAVKLDTEFPALISPFLGDDKLASDVLSYLDTLVQLKSPIFRMAEIPEQKKGSFKPSR